jgi:tRNA(Glu) U13 pseudouridine synthase TruD
MWYSYEGTFYFIQPKKFLGTNIYKIGLTRATKPPYNRIKGYKKGTIVYLTLKIDCVNDFETLIRNLFDYKFEKSHGREWYNGNSQEMIDLILKYYNKILIYDNYLKNENTHILEDYKKEYKEAFMFAPYHPLKLYIYAQCKKIYNKRYEERFEIEQIYIDFDYNNQWSTIYDRYKFKQNISFILGNLHFYNIQQYSEQLLY